MIHMIKFHLIRTKYFIFADRERVPLMLFRTDTELLDQLEGLEKYYTGDTIIEYVKVSNDDGTWRTMYTREIKSYFKQFPESYRYLCLLNGW